MFASLGWSPSLSPVLSSISFSMVWDAVSPAFLSSTQDAVSASPLVSQLVSHLVFQPAKRKLKMNSKVRFLQLFGVYSFFLDPSKFATKPVEGSTGSQCAGNLSRHWGFVQKIRKIVKKQTTEDTKDTELCFFFLSSHSGSFMFFCAFLAIFQVMV